VQVVNVHYGPQEKSALHAHMGGVVVVLTAGHLRFTDENGKVQEVHAKPGDPRWFPPFKHTVENLGDSAYNAVYIGIKDKRLSTELNVRGASSPPDGLKLDGSKLDGSKLDEQTKKIVAEALLAGAK